MGPFPLSRFFRLSDAGVRCDDEGLFVGGMPMLARSRNPNGGLVWAVRPTDEQNRDLGACYGLPIDVAAKRTGLAGVARALERADLPLAQVCSLLLRFPDPPSLNKGAPTRGSGELARQLIESGLLKADWDSSKHPRTGEPPNPGWFAPKNDAPVQIAENGFGPRPTATDAGRGSSGAEPPVHEHRPLAPIEAEPEPPPESEVGLGPKTTGQPEPAPPQADLSPRELMRALRAWLKQESFPIIEMGGLVDWAAATFTDAMARTVAELRFLVATSPGGVDPAVLRALEEALAADDPPKTLAELQAPPTQNVGGYDDHHMVQRNDGNIAKSPLELLIEKFGWNVINAPRNRVWIPRVKHRLITDWYNSTDPNDPRRRRRREVVSEMDYDAQYQDALATLRMFGVLQ